jgi:DNA-binding transcriptional ArsR family regulator
VVAYNVWTTVNHNEESRCITSVVMPRMMSRLCSRVVALHPPDGRMSPRRQFSAAYITAAAHVLDVLSHETRLHMVLVLAQGEATVTELCELVGGAQSNISHHLSILRTTGLVTDRREGQFVVYAINIPMWKGMANGFFDHLVEGQDEVILQNFRIERRHPSRPAG